MKNKVIVVVVLVIIAFTLLVIANNFVLKCRVSFLNSMTNCQPGQPPDQAPPSNETANEPPSRIVTAPKVLYNLAGSIKTLQQNAIILDAVLPLLGDDDQSANNTDARKVLILPATKFTRRSFVQQPGTNRKTAQENAASFSDLKLGDYVEVISNQDITDKKEFEATLVIIMEKVF